MELAGSLETVGSSPWPVMVPAAVRFVAAVDTRFVAVAPVVVDIQFVVVVPVVVDNRFVAVAPVVAGTAGYNGTAVAL